MRSVNVTAFFVGLGFDVLLDARMQEADIGQAGDDLFAIQLEQQAQDAMRAGVVRAHVEQQGFAAQRPFRNQATQLVHGAVPVFLLVTRGRCRRRCCHRASLDGHDSLLAKGLWRCTSSALKENCTVS